MKLEIMNIFDLKIVIRQIFVTIRIIKFGIKKYNLNE